MVKASASRAEDPGERSLDKRLFSRHETPEANFLSSCQQCDRECDDVRIPASLIKSMFPDFFFFIFVVVDIDAVVVVLFVYTTHASVCVCGGGGGGGGG